MKLTSRCLPPLILAVLLLVPATWAVEVHLNEARDGRTLTAPKAGDAEAIALDFVQANLDRLQLTQLDVADLELGDRYRTRHNGMTHLYWVQRLDGIPLHNGVLGVNVLADGRILNLHHRFVPDLASKVNGGPVISPEVAVTRAAEHIGLGERLTALRQIDAKGGPTQQITLSEASISRDPIPVELRYQELPDGRVVLAWRLVINRVDTPDWLDLRVDAATGEVVGIDNWTAHGGPNYRVYPLPADSPNTGTHDLLGDPADGTASPFGWHDTDGSAGAEFTDTRGNNVFAQEDLDDNDSGGFRPDGGAGLTFDFAHDDVGTDPEDGTNLEASITNLFYFNNVMHDVTYQYGFDEPAGNFQENNYGNGGAGSDPVQADALDGSGTDNANFSTPADGFDPRMQMYRFTAPPSLEVNSPGSIAGLYVVGGANFGAPLDAIGVTGDLKLADDGVGTTTDACEALPGGSMTGMVAVIDRGSCEFGTKVLNAEDAGAIAAIVVNNQGDATLTMGPGADGASVTISSVFLGQSDGDAIKAELPGVNATMSQGGIVDRDSDFDNGIIGHEYGHGISNRLTGGPNQSGCLFPQTSEQGGEGWSDFWTLVLSARPEHTPEQPRGVGNYVSYLGDDGPGIRNAPYTTDIAVNPIHDYANVATINAPHGVGEIWMSALWEMYWELVAVYGFDADFYNGTGGNNLTIQLVIDGMKLQPCDPTFIDARDAILAADLANNAGANECRIWRAFAKRGMGENADAGTFSLGDETPDYTVPTGCEASIFTDGFESGDTSAWTTTVN